LVRGGSAAGGADGLGGGCGPKGTLCTAVEGVGEAIGVDPILARLAADASANDCLFMSFSLLGGAARRSTKRPTHSSVPGYEIGPMVKVTRAIHSISCAGLSPVVLKDFFGLLGEGVVACPSGVAGADPSLEALVSTGFNGP